MENIFDLFWIVYFQVHFDQFKEALILILSRTLSNEEHFQEPGKDADFFSFCFKICPGENLGTLRHVCESFEVSASPRLSGYLEWLVFWRGRKRRAAVAHWEVFSTTAVN